MKAHPKAAALLALVTIGGNAMAADEGRIKTLDSIQGSHYLAIQEALKVLDRHKIDLSRFDASVLREDEREYVVLSASEGSTADRKSYGVDAKKSTELDAKALEPLTSKAGRAKQLDRIHGTSFRAIRAASVEFAKRSPNTDLTQYKIEVVKDGDDLVVIFADKDREEGARGNIPGRPGMEIALDPHDLHVVGSNFIR